MLCLFFYEPSIRAAIKHPLRRTLVLSVRCAAWCNRLTKHYLLFMEIAIGLAVVHIFMFKITSKSFG